MGEKRKIQSLNRIPIPTAMLNSLNLKTGDDVHLACDDDRIYLAKRKDKLPKMMALFESSSSGQEAAFLSGPTSLVGALPLALAKTKSLAVNYTDLEQGKVLTQKTIVLCQCGNEIILEKGHIVDLKGAPLCQACAAKILHDKGKVGWGSDKLPPMRESCLPSGVCPSRMKK